MTNETNPKKENPKKRPRDPPIEPIISLKSYTRTSLPTVLSGPASKTKLASSEMAKSALETLSNDIENDLKKETYEASKLLDEANQINAKLEQDLANEKEINQKLQQEVIDGLANFENAKTALETKLMKEAEDAKEISAKFEQDLVKKSESFDQLMESLENEKNKLKIISLEKDGLLEELKEYKNQSQVQNINIEMEKGMDSQHA